jgi:hypothetical protein
MAKAEDEDANLKKILAKIEKDIPEYGINELSSQVQERLKALALSIKGETKPEYSTAIDFII